MNLKAKFNEVTTKFSVRYLSAPLAATAVVLGSGVTAFASDGGNLPTIAITTDMLSPLVEGVIANLTVILPVGLGLFAVFLGIRIIPGVISRFVHM